MSESTSDEVLVTQVQGEMELQLVRDLLERHGIPSRYQGEALRLTHGFTADGLARVFIYVPTAWAERAKELLAALDDGALALDDDDGPAEGTPREAWKDLP